MMSLCSTYDENMSTQDRIWRIVNGALPEFRHKYENKTFDDVDQLLKALIQYEESRLRPSYDEYNQVTNSGRGGQPTIWNQQHFAEAVNQVASNHQRLPWNNKPPAMQLPINRTETNNNGQQPSYPN